MRPFLNIFKKIKELFAPLNPIWPLTTSLPAEEKWYEVPEFNGKYAVNEIGEIKNTTTGKITKGTLNSRGYLVVHLTYDGKDYMRSAHRVVADALYGGIPEGMVVDHINGDKTDNRKENLIITYRKNLKRDNTPRVVRRYTQCVLQLDKEGNILGRFKNAHQAGVATNTSSSNIIAVCKKAYGRKTANGFKWEFEKEAELPLMD